MSKQKRTESRVSATGPQSEPSAAANGAVVALPRAWLAGMAALIIVPWLVAAAMYLTGKQAPAADGPAAASRPVKAGAPVSGASGPWGQLELTPIVISPPLDYVPTDWGPVERPRWIFPEVSHRELEQFLAATGLSTDQVSRLVAAAQPDPRTGGLVVTPDPDLVRQLDPRVRAKIYSGLALTPLNFFQHSAYRHFAPTAEAWLGPSPVSRQTLQIVAPYVYRIGNFVYFADINLVRPQISDAAELQRLAKGLLRESTFLARLRLDDASQVDAIAEYWGRGGRRTDVLPLLESIAGGGPASLIDITHLLPPLARTHLYRYPRITLGDIEKGILVNCFWTALNFFNTKPDDRFLDAKIAIETLKRDYYIVHDKFQLGDIVAFHDANGDYFHASVYVADNLVFGKNGTSSLSPWTIVPMDRLRAYYLDHATPDDWNVVYYRRSGF